MAWKVLVAGPLDAAAEARLAEAGRVVRAPAWDEATLVGAIADCDALVTRTHIPVTRAVLRAGAKLRVVGVAGVGVDRVDVAAAAERDIRVVNTPAAATDAVADLTLALMLQLLRPIPRLADAYRRGEFAAARAAAHGTELCTHTVGIVGMGRIGSAVGRRCAAFGARVLYNDIIPVGPFEFPAVEVTKRELWQQSTIVTLHVPATPQTLHMMNAGVLASLPAGALLINTARGNVVVTPALVEALHGGHLGGVGLDVTDPEPLPPEHPLFAQPDCVLTPHIAARTHGGLERMNAVVDEVLAVLRGA